jgi:hypothetical protein
MNHTPKIIGLVAMFLLIQGDISLAAKDPPPLSPHQYPPAPAQVQVPRPDLVPWKGGGGGIGVKKFSCVDTQSGKVLKITLGIRNSGTAKTTVAVKTLAKVNRQQWAPYDPTQNPHTTPAEMWPNQWQEFHMNGPAPGLGTHTLWVKVDSDNAQVEINENNNVATATTVCK